MQSFASAPVGAFTANDDWTELATRAGDGLEISLHWGTSANRARVTVFDQRRDESLDIEIDGADALSAFHHPFAYVASRTATTDYAERHPLALPEQA